MQLNYHHLWHFHVVAREGGLRAAADHLMISASTLSEQIKSLEAVLGGALFERVGRSLRLTALGRHVQSYAGAIFKTGNELLDSIQHGSFQERMPLRVGVVNAMPKVVVYHLLAPLLREDTPPALSVVEDEMLRLLADLANDQLDVVLSDSPVTPQHSHRLFNHRLGGSELGIFVSRSLNRRFRRQSFPQCLNDQPFLMPTPMSALSFELERWFEEQGLHPQLQVRFENSALLKFFASRGHGAFAAPVIAEDVLKKQYACNLLGVMEGSQEEYIAITSGRRVKHPGVQIIQETAEDFMQRT